MAEGLRIVIGADVKDLEKALQRARKDIDRFEIQAGKGAKGMDKFGKSSVNATPALQEFSRVIQDAPFGIQGVANNITQLTSQFGYLTKQTGGTKAALKAMLGTLAGPAGILLAVSTITSLLVVFGDELFNTGKKADNLKDKFEALEKSLNSELRLNKAISENLKLQDKSTLNQLENKKNIIRASLDKIKVQNQELENELELLKAENKRVDNVELLKGIFDKLLGVLKAAVSFGLNIVSDKVVTTFEKLLGFEIDRSKFASASVEQKKKEQELTDQLNAQRAKALELENDILKTQQEQNKVIQEIASRPKNLNTVGKPSTQGFNIAGQIQSQIPLVTANMEALADELTRINQERIQPVINSISSVFADLGNNIANSLSQSSGVFGAFVGTIIQQSLKLVSQLITASIKSAAATKAQVATVVAAEKAKASASAISAASQSAAASGPGGAFLLPVLIAGALAAISSAFSGIGGGNNGGGATSGVSGATSSGGATSFGSSTSSGSFNGRVVFEIAGDKLIGVLNNTSLGNLRVGDSDQLITTG